MGVNVGNSAAKGNPGNASIGASAAIFDDQGRVLLIKRGKPPLAGLWSLPGGHIDPGESSSATALREIREEAGIEATLVGFLQTFQVPLRDADGQQIAVMPLDVFFGRQLGDSIPVPGDDAEACRYVAIDDLKDYDLTESCEDLVKAAWHRLYMGRPLYLTERSFW